MEKGIIGYFGYGSLVNRATHRTSIVEAVPARLKGWVRCWVPRPEPRMHEVPLLSVRRSNGAATEGLLVFDRIENLPAIDERERSYRRVPLDALDIDHGRDDLPDCPVHVYEVPSDEALSFGRQRIPLSYLDAVLQGFLAEHGEAAVRRFVVETERFEIGILDDRASPIYSRPVLLSEAERAFFDEIIAHLPAVRP